MTVYRITKSNNIIRVSNRSVEHVIKVSTRSPHVVKIVNNGRGPKGADGADGADGRGIIAGGNIG